MATDILSRLIAAAAVEAGAGGGAPTSPEHQDAAAGSSSTSVSDMLAGLFKGRSSSRRLSGSSGDMAATISSYGSQQSSVRARRGRTLLADPRSRDAGSKVPVGSSSEDEGDSQAEVPLPDDQQQEPPGRPTIQQILTEQLMLAAALNEQEAQGGGAGQGSGSTTPIIIMPPSLACHELVPGRRSVGFVQNCSTAVALRQVATFLFQLLLCVACH